MSNSTTPPPDLPILCPEDGRRTPQELYLKLFVVNLTTLIYYCHFLNARDGPAHAACYCHAVYFFLGPLVVVARYIVGLAGILCVFVVRLAKHFIRNRGFPSPLLGGGGDEDESPERSALLYLLGKTRPHDYGQLPSSDPSESGGAGADRRAGSSKVTIGKVVVNLVFLTQCVGSLYLYDRRARHGPGGDAVLPIDRRMLATMCAGLVVGLLNSARAVELPLFRDFMPAGRVDDGSRSALDRFALVCRGHCARHLQVVELGVDSEGKEYDPHYMVFYVNGMFQFLALAVTMDSFFVGAHRFVWDVVVHQWWWVALVVGAVVVFAVTYFYERERQCFDDEPREQRGTTTTMTTTTRVPLIMALISPLFGAGVLYIFFAVYVVVCHWSSFFVMDLSVSEAMAANETSPCPQLWADPMANWVWWLA